tara:strand:- start:210 stop:515 length:306 start_codon:yes stop_codon:yes gene_type:complete
MSYSKKRKVIEDKIFFLQDKVSNELRIDSDVDKFLDNTTLLDEWEDIIPDSEYGIFVIAILNNIRTKTVIGAIVDSILKINTIPKEKDSEKKKIIEQHPFC